MENRPSDRMPSPEWREWLKKTKPRSCPSCGRNSLVVEVIVHKYQPDRSILPLDEEAQAIVYKPGREVVRESCQSCNYFLGYIRKQKIREE